MRDHVLCARERETTATAKTTPHPGAKRIKHTYYNVIVAFILRSCPRQEYCNYYHRPPPPLPVSRNKSPTRYRAMISWSTSRASSAKRKRTAYEGSYSFHARRHVFLNHLYYVPLTDDCKSHQNVPKLHRQSVTHTFTRF